MCENVIGDGGDRAVTQADVYDYESTSQAQSSISTFKIDIYPY